MTGRKLSALLFLGLHILADCCLCSICFCVVRAHWYLAGWLWFLTSIALRWVLLRLKLGLCLVDQLLLVLVLALGSVDLSLLVEGHLSGETVDGTETKSRPAENLGGC